MQQENTEYLFTQLDEKPANNELIEELEQVRRAAFDSIGRPIHRRVGD